MAGNGRFGTPRIVHTSGTRKGPTVSLPNIPAQLHHLLADAAVVSEQETAIHQPSGAPSIRTVRCTTLWLGLARDAALRTTPSLFRILHGEVLGTRDTPAASNTCSPLNTGCSIAAPLIPSVCPTETSLNEP